VFRSSSSCAGRLLHVLWLACSQPTFFCLLIHFLSMWLPRIRSYVIVFVLCVRLLPSIARHGASLFFPTFCAVFCVRSAFRLWAYHLLSFASAVGVGSVASLPWFFLRSLFFSFAISPRAPRLSSVAVRAVSFMWCRHSRLCRSPCAHSFCFFCCQGGMGSSAFCESPLRTSSR